MKLWSIEGEQGEPRNPIELREHTLQVEALAFSPDGRRLAAGDEDLAVREPGCGVEGALQRICGGAEAEGAGRRVEDLDAPDVAPAATTVRLGAAHDEHTLDGGEPGGGGADPRLGELRAVAGR